MNLLSVAKNAGKLKELHQNMLREQEEKKWKYRRQLERELVKEKKKMGYGKQFYQKESRCESCSIRMFCKAVVPKDWLITPKTCSQARNFIRRRLVARAQERNLQEREMFQIRNRVKEV